VKLFRSSHKKEGFDKKTLRTNDISAVILDKRWNTLFTYIEKPRKTAQMEDELEKLLFEDTRLLQLAEELPEKKRKLLNKIMQLSPKAHKENDENAKNKMQEYQNEVHKINKEIEKTEKRLDDMPENIRKKNIDLLESTVKKVYFKIKSNIKRVEELDKMIQTRREEIKSLIDEKETLAVDYTEVYSYFHDLLGSNELEKLDKKYLKGKKESPAADKKDEIVLNKEDG
jgi:ferritin